MSKNNKGGGPRAPSPPPPIVRQPEASTPGPDAPGPAPELSEDAMPELLDGETEPSAPPPSDAQVRQEEVPAPPPPAQLDRRAAAMSERTVAPLPLPHVPVIDEILICRGFENNATVQTKVVLVDEARGQILVWIEALRRHWPVAIERVMGKTWRFVASDYPAPGESTAFDRQFRDTKRTAADPVPEAQPAPFNPPRKARAGHVWARTLSPVTALGYAAEGGPRRRWGPGEHGEFQRSAVSSSPHALKEL